MRLEAGDGATFDDRVRAARGELVVVYFWSDDCPNCEFFARHLPDIASDLEGLPIRIVKVHALEEPELALEHAVYGVPAFHLYRDGRRLGRMSEFRGRGFFVDVLRERATG